MKVFVIGIHGQLGRTLSETAPKDLDFAGDGLPRLDVSDPRALEVRLTAERPDVVVNTAAYTAVDKAEAEPEAARRVNADGAGNAALAARQAGARFIHVSTDFVFDGEKGTPYKPEDTPAPLGVYGQTKLDGEAAVRDATDGDAVIIRTAWLYSRFGNNFVKTMLQLMAERDELSVVADQCGTPTWAHSMADVIWAAIGGGLPGGLYHWTDGGEASWHEFAEAIQREARALGMLDRDVTIRPIPTADYPTPARRPAYSVLDCSATVSALGLRQRAWQTSLRHMLSGLRN
jgi:dTDP-4-dehydrorhamnose reductase